MKSLKIDELLKIQKMSMNLAKQYNNRQHAALAFGRDQMLRSFGYLDIDTVALSLAELLAGQYGKGRAAHMVKDGWGVWMRVVAAADAEPERATFWYICSFTDARGKRQYMTLGSQLDPDQPGNLYRIAADIRDRTGVALKNYSCIDMTKVLARVRAQAAEAGFDFSESFLPPLGDPRLEELLKPYDEAAMPDRAVVIDNAIAKRLQRAGAKARTAADAMVH